MDSSLFAVTTAAHCFDIQFHPREPVLVAASITGEIELHRYDVSASTCEPLRHIQSHAESCRAARFLAESVESGATATRLASASADCHTVVTDVEQGKSLWKAKLRAAGNALLPLDSDRFVVGDDDGSVAVYDVRKKKPAARFSENEDFISDLAVAADGFRLCATSGDGTLAVYDLRKRGEKGLIAMSDFQEDEFLSVSIIKDGKKVLCGSQGGVLAIFSWGDFGDQKDRIKGHPMSIEAIAKISEDAVLTGSSDGKIRIVGVHTREIGSSICGVLGEHGAYPLEGLSLSADGGMVASLSHSQPAVRVWSTEHAHRILSNLQEIADGGSAGVSMGTEAAEDSDDSDDSAPRNKKKRRKKGLAKRQAAKAARSTSNFFSDL